MTNFFETAKNGWPVSHVNIIDSHCHMGFYKCFHNPQNTAQDMIRKMDIMGVQLACVSPHPAIGPDFRMGNDMAISAVMKYPDRFYGYAVVNPNYESEMKDELDRCLAVPGMIGIKIHPSFHGCTIDYRSYHLAYGYADAIRCPVLLHVWGKGDVAAVGKIAAQYPNAAFIMGHAGAEIRAMEDACEVAGKYSNVYVDLALSAAYQGNVEWLVSRIGSEKVLYGTDMPFFDPLHTFGRIMLAQLDDCDKVNILGYNMERILSRRTGKLP